MKRLFKFIIFVLIFALTLSLVACNNPYTGEMNLQAEDVLTPVYEKGTQTIKIVASAHAEKPTLFKSDINISDIELGDWAQGKTVTNVEWVDETTIKVTMTGTTQDFSEDWELGLIVVKARACSLNVDCYTYFKIYNTYLTVEVGDSQSGEAGNAYSEYYTIFTLNNGSFSPDFNPYDKISIVPYGDLTLPNPMTNGKIVSCMIDSNRLIIRINFVDQSISRYPKVKIGAGLIPGSPEFEIEIGKDPLDYAPIIL